MIDEKPYWWCVDCNKNVNILHAPGQGMYCINCGKKVIKPTNIPDPLFIDEEDEEWKELPHEQEDINENSNN